jgi:Zn-dependent M28 family amino/carboxypeptidase
MMMDLASYFSNPQNQPDYSIVFIALCGEEAGLLGSTYCADNPPFSLQKVKFLINLDMVGTGSEGITVVNATIFKDAFSTLQKINTEKNYVTKVNAREESCNSDHCPFYKKGVPSVFIYSLGKEYLEYHNVNDQASKLPLTDYEDIFRLMRDFIQTY